MARDVAIAFCFVAVHGEIFLPCLPERDGVAACVVDPLDAVFFKFVTSYLQLNLQWLDKWYKWSQSLLHLF